jgi:hypothetical protein
MSKSCRREVMEKMHPESNVMKKLTFVAVALTFLSCGTTREASKNTSLPSNQNIPELSQQCKSKVSDYLATKYGESYSYQLTMQGKSKDTIYSIFAKDKLKNNDITIIVITDLECNVVRTIEAAFYMPGEKK